MKSPDGTRLYYAQDFIFYNTKNITFNIKLLSLIGGSADDKFIAYPFLEPLPFTPKKEFRVTASNKAAALEKCMNLLKDIDFLQVISQTNTSS